MMQDQMTSGAAGQKNKTYALAYVNNDKRHYTKCLFKTSACS